MSHINKTFLVSIGLAVVTCLCAQQNGDSVLSLTLKQAVELARQQSPEIVQTRHTFRQSYWSYIYFKADYLPSLQFSSSPRFNHSIREIGLPDGTSQYVPQNQLSTNANLFTSQNIALTGGNFTIQTGLQRLDELTAKSSFYNSTPVVIGFSQSLNGYNALKWNKKIEPLKFEAAKRNYVEMLEVVSTNATSMFFQLAKAQTDLDIAQTNYNNADTRYTVAQGRYDIGTITESEMLQLEIGKLREENAQLTAGWSVDDCMENLRSYLGIKDAMPIKVVIEPDIPLNYIDPEKALNYALENNKHSLNMQRTRLQSESEVARAKASTGLQADLYMELGLGQTGADIPAAYTNPTNMQYVTLGFRLPILDWGYRKGRVQVAKSQLDLVLTQIEQTQNNFEMNVSKSVKQFNFLSERMNVVTKADIIAERSHEVARQLYLLEKYTIIELNTAITEKDTAKRNYIQSLYDYWNLYYTLRSITLFDFEKNIPITEDYEYLIK